MSVELYDPLTYENLMAGLALHFGEQPKVPLDGTDDVAGPGIYALFYAGPMSMTIPYLWNYTRGR